jgi:2-polyprenyl-3-methyl-5-hydroxy-6-metoxy-1,4-benzoquinol methylase
VPAEFRLLSTYTEKLDLIESYINAQGGDRKVEILEAGCGRSWPFKSLGVSYTLTGIDLDSDALEYRKTSRGDLDTAIVGDLRTATLPASGFDVIYSDYVLEHIKGVDTVLDNFVRWLRAGGVLIISVPDPTSVSGFLTRCTPHWLHVLAHRHALGNRAAGTSGHGPYQTHYEQAITKAGMLRFAESYGFDVREFCGLKNLATMKFGLLFRILQLVSFGTIRADHADLVFVFQKPAHAAIPGS